MTVFTLILPSCGYSPWDEEDGLERVKSQHASKMQAWATSVSVKVKCNIKDFMNLTQGAKGEAKGIIQPFKGCVAVKDGGAIISQHHDLFKPTASTWLLTKSNLLLSSYMRNKDVRCQIHGNETANWFVIRDFKFTRHLC